VQCSTRNDTESQGRDGRECECGDDSEPGSSDGQAGNLSFIVGTLGNCESEAQVIGRSKAGVEKTNDGEDDRASADGGGEGVELAEEAAGEWNSDERDEEEDDQGAEERRAVDEAFVVGNEGTLVVVAARDGDECEDADVHGGIGCGVKGSGGDPGGAESGKGREEITGVGDGGVGEHALDVLLSEGGEVADRHGEDRDDPQDGCPDVAQVGEHLVDETKEEGEGRGLGRS